MPVDIEKLKSQPEDKLVRAIELAYKHEPTLENYIALREAFPELEFEVSATNGLDWLLSNEDVLEKYNIEPRLIAKALDADSQAISQISLKLMQHILDRDRKLADGGSHVVSRGEGIPDTLVNFLISIMLDASSWTEAFEIQRDLIVLIRHQLIGAKPLIAQQLDSLHFKQNILLVGAHLMDADSPVTARSVAKILGVAPSSVTRAYENEDLVESVRQFKETLNMFKLPDDKV